MLHKQTSHSRAHQQGQVSERELHGLWCPHAALWYPACRLQEVTRSGATDLQAHVPGA